MRQKKVQLEKSIQEAENVKKEAEAKINAAKKELGLPVGATPKADATLKVDATPTVDATPKVDASPKVGEGKT